MTVVAVSAASIAVAWLVGLWTIGLLKDAVILTATVVLPMTFRSFSFKSGGDLSRSLVRETLTLTAVLTLYLDTATLPLGWELLFQVVVTFFATTQVVAATRSEWRPAKRLCDVVLTLAGAFLICWTTVKLVQVPPDWAEFFQSLFFGFWLPLSLLPFFYIFGFYAVAETVRARFSAFKKPLSLRLMAALIIGTRFKLGLLTQLNGRYTSVADASGFRDGLARMRAFREDLARRGKAELERVETLSRNSGRAGVDSRGLHLDRREFDATKNRLDWIWTCQNGQWERQGGRYWDHLTDWIVDAEEHGLPAEHGVMVEVSNDGQVWRAWRQTPGGAVLGAGGRERSSRFYFQGDSRPRGWPGESDEWVDASAEQWPPDWDYNDRSRL
ncbi:MAG: hypothetical protein JSS74_11525 [Actinobacteria bacterium]|nr:hypothetical protein [Actinomycetota bacterium]